MVDHVVVGGGHNGLVTACCLARAGKSVLVLERSTKLGGADPQTALLELLDPPLSGVGAPGRAAAKAVLTWRRRSGR